MWYSKRLLSFISSHNCAGGYEVSGAVAEAPVTILDPPYPVDVSEADQPGLV
jgi:hypothetical protein